MEKKEYIEQLNLLKRYTEGFDKNLIEDLDKNEIDVWVAEFLKEG